MVINPDCCNLLRRGRRLMKSFKPTNERSNPHYYVLSWRNMGTPKPLRRQGDRATGVVVGVTSYQGNQESWLQGKGWQGLQPRWGRYARCEEPKLMRWLAIIYDGNKPGKPSASKGCPLGLGKGGLETCWRLEYGNGECPFQSLPPALLETK